MVPADEKIDPYLVPHLDGPEDFVEHGETEIVQMELPLTSLNAEDMAPRIGQIMGPFHESVAMPGNELHLQDTVRNLKRVVATLKRDRGLGNEADGQLLARVQIHPRPRRRAVSEDAAGRAAAGAAGPADARTRNGSANGEQPQRRWLSRWARRGHAPPERRPATPPATPRRRRRRRAGAPMPTFPRGAVAAGPDAHVLHHQRRRQEPHPGDRAAGDHRQGQGHRREPPRQAGAGADSRSSSGRRRSRPSRCPTATPTRWPRTCRPSTRRRPRSASRRPAPTPSASTPAPRTWTPSSSRSR